MHSWQEFGLLGEDPALQFVNTVDDAGKTRFEDGLPDWSTLLAWGSAAGVLTEMEASTLEQATDTPEAESELRAVHDLREATWRVLHAKAAGEEDADAEDEVAAVARWAFGRSKLRSDARCYEWRAVATAEDPALPRIRLGLIVERFLRSEELTRLRECGRCAAVFLDHGRGRGRRWCRMATCGNRAKAERFRGRS